MVLDHVIPAFFSAQHASVMGANHYDIKEETVVRRIFVSELGNCTLNEMKENVPQLRWLNIKFNNSLHFHILLQGTHVCKICAGHHRGQGLCLAIYNKLQ